MGAANCLHADDERSSRILEGARQTRADPSAVVLVSGGFDPIHVGHVRMLRAAAEMGRVYVALNSDGWLCRKKGRPFMNWAERAEILRACRWVREVVHVDDADGTVCTALALIQPDIFANGGDRTIPNRREHLMCKRLGIREIFNVGGCKIQSSSDLIRGALGHHKNTVSG